MPLNGDLNENGPNRLKYLNTWFSVEGIVCGRIRKYGFLEENVPPEILKYQKSTQLYIPS